LFYHCFVIGIIAGAILKYTGGTIKKSGFHSKITLPRRADTLFVSVANDTQNYSYIYNGVAHTFLTSEGGELENKVIRKRNVGIFCAIEGFFFQPSKKLLSTSYDTLGHLRGFLVVEN